MAQAEPWRFQHFNLTTCAYQYRVKTVGGVIVQRRKDPLLEGQLVFEMITELSAEISGLTLFSSELHDAALTQKFWPEFA